MKNRLIFFKSRKKYRFLYFFICLLLVSLIPSFFFQKQHEFFIVKDNKEKFYIIPKDNKAKNIINKDIKILDYDYNLEEKIIKNYLNNKFSIQLFASTEYENILKKYNYFANNYSFLEADLYIFVLKHNLGINYLLVYKNFNNHKNAFNYCINYLNFIENCLIVDVYNLD